MTKTFQEWLKDKGLDVSINEGPFVKPKGIKARAAEKKEPVDVPEEEEDDDEEDEPEEEPEVEEDDDEEEEEKPKFFSKKKSGKK
jgi:TATA-binding protein-associated factor Taf7